MKKTVLALLIFSGISFAAKSQLHEKGDIELGANFGYSSATANANDYNSYNSSYNNAGTKSGFNAGVQGDYYFSNRWSIKAKIIYDQKGFKNSFVSTGESIEYGTANLNYVTVPVMANWHFGKTRNWYLHFGPYVGFLTGANCAGYNIKENINTVDFGLAYGIGIRFPISETARLFIEMDGQGGFLDLYKNNSTQYTFTNNRGSLNVGVAFPLK